MTALKDASIRDIFLYRYIGYSYGYSLSGFHPLFSIGALTNVTDKIYTGLSATGIWPAVLPLPVLALTRDPDKYMHSLSFIIDFFDVRLTELKNGNQQPVLDACYSLFPSTSLLNMLNHSAIKNNYCL